MHTKSVPINGIHLFLPYTFVPLLQAFRLTSQASTTIWRQPRGWYTCFLVWVFASLTSLAILSMWGCTTINQESDRPRLPPSPTQSSVATALNGQIVPTAFKNPQAEFSLEDRMLLSSTLPEPPQASTPSLGPLYSFRAQELPIIDALALFARSNHLNIVAGPEITGTVTVDFHHLPLERAMSALLEAHGYYWEHLQDLILVKRFKTKTLNVDYIRLVRSGTGKNRAQLNSGSGAGTGGSASQDTGQITVNQEDEIKFWEELEKQIKALMSAEGRLVVNRLSGTIQITDRFQRVREIDHFLKSVHQALYRQVEIEVRIYEIALDDQFSLGIDWNRINFDGTNGTIALANIITAPFGGFMAKAATTTISFEDGSFDRVLEALAEQGDIRVISQPRVITMNNQPALIKVATDQAFFTSTIAQGTAGSGNIVTEQARSVTVGLVLSVTPQISEDGWIMLDVTPILSRLRDIVTSPQKTATAPVLDVKQSSGLIRLKDGEMVIIRGFIQEESSETERKVPLLGDIPMLGRLFKGTHTAKRKSELVIFISPKIIRASS